MIPAGYHRILPNRAALVEPNGSPASPVPGANASWPVLIRLKAIPLGGNIATPSFAEKDWYQYCGPVRADMAYGVVEAWKAGAFAAGYHLAFERIHILPNLAGYPWPAPGCYGWQAETSRPLPEQGVYVGYGKIALKSAPGAEPKGAIA